jgi:hypothetical protein
MIKWSVILVATGFFCVNGFAQTSAQNDVFGFGDWAIGIITNNNRVQFYEYGDSWTVMDDIEDMILPNGYSGVFSLGVRRLIGIITNNNKVQFYAYMGKWTIMSDADMTLPNGYKGVFGLNGGVIGIITNNNKVQFYAYTDKWTIMPDVEDMTLPNGYKGVFGLGESGIIGIIINNRIQFYEYNGKIWTIVSSADYIKYKQKKRRITGLFTHRRQ